MRTSERIASVVAIASVGSAGLLGVYTLTGPVLHTPIVVTIPDGLMDVVAGHTTIGLYVIALPDFVFMTEQGKNDPATLPHEMLHYGNPTWSECEVSTHLYETTGLADGYRQNGDC